MISANWETPSQQSSSEEKSNFNDPSKFNDPFSGLDQINFFLNEKTIKPPKQLKLFEIETSGLISNKVIYDPTGPVPFPKTHDLDDKTISTDPDVIGKLLAKYSIVCPGAESLEISQDASDPLVTVFTIKKTFF